MAVSDKGLYPAFPAAWLWISSLAIYRNWRLLIPKKIRFVNKDSWVAERLSWIQTQEVKLYIAHGKRGMDEDFCFTAFVV